MNRKLDFLVPHYKEDEKTVKDFLDSIKLQQCVDFNDIGVIIVNDGDECKLSNEFLNSYPFKIEYHIEKHEGVSATRNKCLDYSNADYVMFCDIDDMFCNICGLWIIFREFGIDNGFDGLVSNFVEETRDQDKKPIFVNHENDSTFVHGKVWRRKYLINNNLRFNPKLTIHEDSYFNILARSFSKEIKYCQTQFYLWKWRDNSVCRHDPKYILKTYNNMIDSNTELVKEFLDRKDNEKAKFFVGFMFFDAYYTMCKPDWKNQENQEYRHKTELRFKDYYNEFKNKWEKELNDQEKMFISNQIRSRSVNEGMQMENITLDSWLDYISNLK